MRVVIDTNVLVEGLGRQGTCGAIVDAWVARRFRPCVTTALALEYEAVLLRGRSPERCEQVRRALQALLSRAAHVVVHLSYRPQSPDPGDDLVIDCAMNGRAAVVTSNRRDFESAARSLGFSLLSPTEFLARLQED